MMMLTRLSVSRHTLRLPIAAVDDLCFVTLASTSVFLVPQGMTTTMMIMMTRTTMRRGQTSLTAGASWTAATKLLMLWLTRSVYSLLRRVYIYTHISCDLSCVSGLSSPARPHLSRAVVLILRHGGTGLWGEGVFSAPRPIPCAESHLSRYQEEAWRVPAVHGTPSRCLFSHQQRRH